MMHVTTRFAPSPTGFLHVGNVRTALICWLFARANQGKFILRIDDTDQERSQQVYVDAIKEDLAWLGLDWDLEVVQSHRVAQHETAKEMLLKAGRLYPCYETTEELQIKRKLLLGQNKPPIYDRAALSLTEDQKRGLESSGIKPHYRFLLEEGKIEWDDLVRGHIGFDTKNLSDPVLIRADGTMTYSIASVVDDIEFGISHIVRGEDHITNSATHVQLFAALGAKAPNFAHTSLLKSKEGEISKRYGGFEIRALREHGVDRMAILSLLAKMGTSDAIERCDNLHDLINTFSLAKQSRATVTYDVAELTRLNTQIIHNKSFEDVKDELHNMGLPLVTAEFWNAVRHNIANLHEVKEWYNVCCSQIQPDNDDLEFTSIAAELLPKEEFSGSTWDQWIKNVKEKTGRTGKNLFMPIRKALTGIEHGPELRVVLMILGRERAYQRLVGLRA